MTIATKPNASSFPEIVLLRCNFTDEDEQSRTRALQFSPDYAYVVDAIYVVDIVMDVVYVDR